MLHEVGCPQAAEQMSYGLSLGSALEPPLEPAPSRTQAGVLEPSLTCLALCFSHPCLICMVRAVCLLTRDPTLLPGTSRWTGPLGSMPVCTSTPGSWASPQAFTPATTHLAGQAPCGRYPAKTPLMLTPPAAEILPTRSQETRVWTWRQTPQRAQGLETLQGEVHHQLGRAPGKRRKTMRRR